MHFPESIVSDGDGVELLGKIFSGSNSYFKPFYSICDSMGMIARKRKTTGFAVDLQAELLGVFWRTYFGQKYVDFFGKNRFQEISSLLSNAEDGIAIKLGESPLMVSSTREEVENILGKDSFVDPSLAFDKPIGKSALKFDKF